VDGVKSRVASGDGASWIRSAAEASGAVLQLDPYHRNKAILKAISEKNGRKAVFEAIREQDVPKALRIIVGLIAKAKEGPEREALGGLYDYMSNNRDSLLTWQERKMELPAPPEGIHYRGLGTQEASNCNLLTQRMKHRKGSWSIQGGNRMAKMLCLRGTVGLDIMFGILPTPEAVEPLMDPLSAAKAPVCDGKGYGGEWLHAPMPFERAFRTQGREAIRGLLTQRPLSGLAYR